ncbi:uncharacterized protein LOC114578844 [Dendrobium catenatum]|uniref:uncharacterized protein LOC114578844 n=1 Tax=Dendrobium catenatum TaxID=906689 RepID=UPI00109F926D|nr:uncharacterized protein LOC114578844 [Dendrobium catenatum]
MTEMMAQIGAMMQMMQKTVVVGAMPNPPPDPPNFQMPQVSGARGTLEGGNEVHNVIRQPTPQNIASASEPVTTAQLEGIITERIRAIIAVDQAEKLVGKGRPYPAEYDHVPYSKGYSIPKFNTFNGTNNPRQYLAQFKATCGNTGGNDALLFQQFVSSLTATTFEWYAELPNDSVKTFAELESMFVKIFASATEKITIADLALDKRKREESVTKYITRWRNLSMKYMLDRVAKFEKLNLSRSENHSDKFKKAKAPGARRGDADSMFFSIADREKQVEENARDR